jgi:hypothetical protein
MGRLRAVHPSHPIEHCDGEHLLAAMVLPDGRQILTVDDDYDLWQDQNTSLRFGLTLEEARKVARS